VGTSIRVPPVHGPGASQVLNEHPWCPKAHALAVLFLPAFVGNFLKEDCVAHCNDFMGLFAMQTLAMGSQFALFFRFCAPGLLIALALLPRQVLPGSLLDATFGIIVVGIGRSPLALHFPLQAADLSLIGSQFLTQLREAHFPFSGKQGDGRWPKVCPDDVLPNGVLGFAVGNAFQGELHEVAITLQIGSFSLGTAGAATDQTSVLDRLIQAVLDDRIVSVDDRFELILLPKQIAPVACFWRLDHKTEPRIVALILDAGQAPSPAAKAHPLPVSQTDPVERLISPRRERLSQDRIQVLDQPTDP
jgi:hypothetical protein